MAKTAARTVAKDGGEDGGKDGGEDGGKDGGEDGGTGPKWYEGDGLTNEEREWLTARGLAADDPAEVILKAVKGHRAAEVKLGRPPEELIGRPGKDQSVTDWMKEHREIFGLPEKADDYKFDRPEMPKGVEYDEALETEVKQIAFEEGVRPEVVKRLVDAYVGRIGGVVQNDLDTIAEARNAMNAALDKEWGDQRQAKTQLARQAMTALATETGFDAGAIEMVSQALSEKVGDPGVIKLFATIGEMMGDDKFEGFNKGGGQFATTPAEARQQLQQLRSPEGEYGRAYAQDDAATMRRLQPEIERLTKIAAGS